VKLKTHGNAFSVLRFLEMLQRDGLLTFSLRVYRWEWDADRINAETSVTANVGELLAARIETLPSQMKGFLMMAACIGQSFHEEILEQVAVEESLSGTSTEVGEGESEEVVRKLCRACLHRVLRQSCRAGLIEREEKQSTYRFSHDLVHKCLYSMIKKQNLQPLHLRIGRAMRQHDSFETDEKAVFATVNHLNEGAYHIDDEEERIFLLKLNLETSERAKAAYSFHSAAIFLEKGILNVDHSEDWDTHYDLVLEIYTSAAEVQYARGKLEKSLELADEVIAHARCIEDEVRAHFIKVNVLGVQRKLSEALEEGFKVLDLLGCHIPRKLKKVHLFMDLMQIRKIMLGKSAEAFMSMAPMTDVLKVYTLRLLDSMTLLLWMIGDDSQVSILMTRMILITLKHGVSVYSPFSFASYGMLLSYMGDERGAYRFGTLALQLAGSLRSKLSLARTALIVYTFTNHLNNPLIDSLDPMLNAHRLGLQVGDVEYSSMCLCT
jgi:predicted ATPase